MSTIVLKALVNMTHTEDREKYNVGGEFVTCNLVNNLVCPPKNAWSLNFSHSNPKVIEEGDHRNTRHFF